MAGSFTAVSRRRWRHGLPRFGAAHFLTLFRALAASMLCGTALSGRGVRPAWLALLAGCTVSDWLDGPLARRAGLAGPFGELLDLEADSWLTLWAAVAAARLRRLPASAMLAPSLRYASVVVHRGPTARRPWQRAAGVAQMAVLCASLGPWGPLRRWARAAAAPATALQLAALFSSR